MNNDCKCNKPNTVGANNLRGCRLLAPKCCKDGVFFNTIVIPKSMGGSSEGEPFAPKNGMYYNALVRYEADDTKFLYDSEGNYTDISGFSPEEIEKIVSKDVDRKIQQISTDGTLETLVDGYVAPDLTALDTKISNEALTRANADNALSTRIDNEALTRSNTDSSLQSQISGLASGSPLAASSTADMTDTSRIYVNTTDGYWYYYDGSDWVSGGIYQASQSTDDVEGLLYNQINENMKYFLGFELGFYNGNTGANISVNNRIRSQAVVFDYDVYLPRTANVRAEIILLNNDNSFKSYLSHPVSPKKGYFIPKGQHFKLWLDYDVQPEGGRPEITDVEESYLFSDFKIIPFWLNQQDQINELNKIGITVDPDNLKYNFNFIVGWRDNGKLKQSYDTYTRITTLNVIKAEQDIYVPANDDYDIYLNTYSTYDENDLLTGAWQNITSNPLKINKGTYFALTITSHPHGTYQSEPVLYDNYNNPVFKALEIYGGTSYDLDTAITNLKASISEETLDSKYNNVEIDTSKISDYVDIISDNKSDNYLFFTDPHTMGSNGTYTDELNNKYLSVIQKFYYQSPCDFLICGGDWLNTGDTPAQAKEKLSIVHGVCNYLFSGQILQLVGNHDINEYGASSERISSQTVANILNNKYGKNYYRYDSANASYYILDTDTDASNMSTYRWEQIDWLAKDLIAHDREHNTLVFHVLYPLHPNDSSRTNFANNLDSLITAYNAHTTVTLNSISYDFRGCTGKIDYSLVGHSHQDFNETLGGVPVIATINLRANNNPSFDLISVDYTNMKFKTIRVGEGLDREITIG